MIAGRLSPIRLCGQLRNNPRRNKRKYMHTSTYVCYMLSSCFVRQRRKDGHQNMKQIGLCLSLGPTHHHRRPITLLPMPMQPGQQARERKQECKKRRREAFRNNYAHTSPSWQFAIRSSKNKTIRTRVQIRCLEYGLPEHHQPGFRHRRRRYCLMRPPST